MPLTDRYSIECLRCTTKPSHIIEANPNLNVFLFICRQLSGIGMSGSFQYKHPFIASPVVLQGRDDEDDYDSDGNELIEEDSDEDNSGVSTFFRSNLTRGVYRYQKSIRYVSSIHCFDT